MSRRRLIIFATLAFAVFGFFVVRAPSPVIALAAEPVFSIGSYEVTNTILSAWVVIVLLAFAAFLVWRRTRDVEAALVPSGFQNLVEAIYEAFMGISQQVGGERNGKKFFPFVFTIFIFLLIGNWFALFPWNNVIGPVENYRYHYLHEMEISVIEVVEDIEAGERELSGGEIDAINGTFQTAFFMPIHFSDYETGSFQETHAASDIHIAELMDGHISEVEAHVRAEFLSDPLPSDLNGADLEHALAERLEAAGVVEKYVHDAIFYNLPLAAADAELVRATGPILSGAGFKIVPPRTLFDTPRDFSYDAFAQPVFIDSQDAICLPSEDRECSGDAALTTVNTAHIGFVQKLDDQGFAGETVGHIFPIFRALASDVNLPLALALWSFLAVQYFGIRGVGIGANFGKYIGVGSHAIVKGPMGVFVGILEIVSEVGRVISFTFRLFGNIFAGEVVLFISMFLVAFVVPTVFFGLEVFVGFIQAFVFAMLTLVFASTAVGDHDEHHDEAAEH
ncbi:MAG: F0F1 ATP synthase subunit A [Chloroflexi bacterium]|nr:F0F1 ATP synthase subunit A [Chloroflexota bacterium]